MMLELSGAQRAIAHMKEDKLLVEAVAGAGKTRTMVGRYIWLLENKVSPRETLILTYTRKAAQEIRDRIKALNLPEPEVKTVHAFCLDQVRKWVNPYIIPVFREDIKHGINPDNDDVVYVEDPINEKAMEHLTAEILSKHERANIYKAVLWDEAQDTSQADYELLKAINPKHLFIVGDMNQAIYGFAGRYGDLMTKLDKVKRVALYQDHRNYSEIASLAALVIRQDIIPVHKGGEAIILPSYKDVRDLFTADEKIGVLADTNMKVRRISVGSGVRHIEASPYRLWRLFTWARYRRLAKYQIEKNPWVVRQASFGISKEKWSMLRLVERVVDAAKVLWDEDWDDVFNEYPNLPFDFDYEKYFDWYLNREWLDYEKENIQAMTVHASKGKEFDTVMLIDRGGFHWVEDEEELRKLYYVAITRAKRKLVIWEPVSDLLKEYLTRR